MANIQILRIVICWWSPPHSIIHGGLLHTQNKSTISLYSLRCSPIHIYRSQSVGNGSNKCIIISSRPASGASSRYRFLAIIKLRSIMDILCLVYCFYYIYIVYTIASSVCLWALSTHFLVRSLFLSLTAPTKSYYSFVCVWARCASIWPEVTQQRCWSLIDGHRPAVTPSK